MTHSERDKDDADKSRSARFQVPAKKASTCTSIGLVAS